MSKIKLNYAICQYTPDPLRAETINVGMVFHYWYEKDAFSEFRRIKNRSRLASFDDEYDKEYIDMMFDSFSYDFDYNLIHRLENEMVNEFKGIKDDNFLYSKTKYYVNEFSFTNIRSIYTTLKDINEDINDLQSTYLYYDKVKNERISTDRVRKLISKHIVKYGLNKKLKEPEISDIFNNKIFDFQYDQTYIKAFSLDYKRQSDLHKNIKVLLHDLHQNQEVLSNKNLKMIIDKDYDDDNKYIEMINNSFDNNSFNLKIEPLNKYLEEITSKGLS